MSLNDQLYILTHGYVEFTIDNASAGVAKDPGVLHTRYVDRQVGRVARTSGAGPKAVDLNLGVNPAIWARLGQQGIDIHHRRLGCHGHHGAMAMVATGRKAPHFLKHHHAVQPQTDHNDRRNGGPQGF